MGVGLKGSLFVYVLNIFTDKVIISVIEVIFLVTNATAIGNFPGNFAYNLI